MKLCSTCNGTGIIDMSNPADPRCSEDCPDCIDAEARQRLAVQKMIDERKERDIDVSD